MCGITKNRNLNIQTIKALNIIHKDIETPGEEVEKTKDIGTQGRNRKSKEDQMAK